MEIKNKVAVVTGSAGGLGKAMLERLGARGAICIVTDINADGVQNAVDDLKSKGMQAHGIVCNVAQEESVEQLFQKIRTDHGRLDVAVLNAGILRDGLLIRFNKATGKIKGKMSLEQWQSVIDVNLTGVFLTAREAAAHMAELGNGGVIVPIASVAMHGNPGQTNYSAAKAGVAAMTRLWTRELSKFQIRVAGIAPGFIATEMVMKDMNQKALEAWKEKIPIGRLGEPDEIAHTLEFIVENDLVSGVVLEISGGIHI
ncbi:MAG: SDR family oxidoreductase [Leptospiraceae bacterium]|nr:SDR family oxidoreductase [Leptospiraceae bacterium]MCB1321640.1 SDR family oxidoreductase [Leptospiraceae bacterium]